MKKIIAGIIAFLAVCTAAAAYLERKYLNTEKPNFDGGVTRENLDWIKDQDYKETYMISKDGYCLHGVMFHNNSDNWIIAVHGYDSEWRGMVRYIQKFLGQGYSVFLPDMRGFGLSEGIKTSMGHFEKEDIKGWIKKLITEDHAKNIILFGVSMGAASVMLTAGERLPEKVRAVVEDCGYSSVREEFEYQMKRTVHIPPYPVLWICDIITRLGSGWSFLNDADCVKAVKRAELPICFIHGEADTFVPFFMLDKLYNACRNPEKEKLVVPGAEHTEACVKQPEKYWDTVFGFIGRHLK